MVFKKIIFQNRYVALETPLRPPPFMANAILNFHFDFPHTSLILSKPKIKVLCSFPVLSVQWRGFVESRCDFSNESRLAMFTHYHHHQQQQLWQQNWSDRKSRDFIRRCEIIQPRDIPCIVVSDSIKSNFSEVEEVEGRRMSSRLHPEVSSHHF